MTTKTSKKPARPEINKAGGEHKKIETIVPVYNFFDAKELRKIELPQKVFDGKINNSLVHQVILMYQAAKRAGTASTKTRGEVSGGGKKPWRQKGTGRARAGSIRSPLWRGGGTVFGPHPKDYLYSLPRKMKRLAVKSVLNGKLRDSELFFVDNIKLEKPKTKIFAGTLKNFLKHNTHKAKSDSPKKDNTSAMIIVGNPNANLKLASRNIQHVQVTGPDNFNALDILLHKNLIVSEDALKQICKRIAG